MDTNELQHHGVKGMKWGQRRYQNKDGTLTAKGKKRYEKELAKLSKEERIIKNKIRTKAKLDKLAKKRKELDDMNEGLSGKKKKVESGGTPTKTTANGKITKQTKPIGEMTDDELGVLVKRLENEAKYKKYKPEHETLGKKFVKKILKDVVAPVAVDYAKNSLGNTLKNAGNAKASNNDNKSKKDNSSKKEKVYEGTVSGKGNSKTKYKEQPKSKVWDFDETWTARSANNYAKAGEAYVTNVLKLLE